MSKNPEVKFYNTAYPGSMFPRKEGDGAYLEAQDFLSQANNLVAAIQERDRRIEDLEAALKQLQDQGNANPA